MTVPASPQSIWASLVQDPGVTSQASVLVSTPVPSAVRAEAINEVSRERSAPRIVLGPSAFVILGRTPPKLCYNHPTFAVSSGENGTH